MTQKIKLLIVDDETQILQTYKEFFEKRNFEVLLAEDGEQGLKALKNYDIDVAILDLLMPKLGGLQLAEIVAKEGIDTSLIILTGHGDKDHAIKAINLNIIDGWFEKATISMDELLAKVKKSSEIISLDDVRRILSSAVIEISENENK